MTKAIRDARRIAKAYNTHGIQAAERLHDACAAIRTLQYWERIALADMARSQFINYGVTIPTEI